MESVVSFANLSDLHINACNFNYSKEGILHPSRVLNEFDLLYLSEGSWDIYEEEICYHVQKDNVLILEPGKHHYSKECCTPGMRNMYIHFNVSDYDSHTASEVIPHQMTPESIPVSKLTDCSENYRIRHLFEEMVETCMSRKSCCLPSRTKSLLTLILCELADTRNNLLQPADVLIEDVIHRFYTSMERFYSSEELAEEYALSPRSLSTRFKKETGSSIHQYQIHLKLEMAYDLIPFSPGRSFRDIALSLGFYDEFQFSKLFNRQYGITPSARR